jgi:hypothetical protein
MPALIAFLPTLIGLIPSVVGAAQAIINFVAGIRKVTMQTGEWTPDLERQFMDALIARCTDPAWQPDAPPK